MGIFETKFNLSSGIINIHFHNGWETHTLPLNNIEKVNFSLEYKENTSNFFKHTFNVNNVSCNFLQPTFFMKGYNFISPFNLGSFYKLPPIKSIHIPTIVFSKETNDFISFENKSMFTSSITLINKPFYIK